eukprot:scaffold50024_cov69-Cyclotella_meneghiniana.AAC.1
MYHQNVAIAKSNRIEIRQFTKEDGGDNDPSLPLLLTLPIYGRPTILLAITFPSVRGDFLFFATDRGDYALISYDDENYDDDDGIAVHSNSKSQDNKESQTSESAAAIVGKQYPVKTHASGTFQSYATNFSSANAECGPLAAHHPKCLALHLYDGYVTILPIHTGYDGSSSSNNNNDSSSSMLRNTGKKGPFGDAFHLRIEERTVLHMTFLLESKGSGGGSSNNISNNNRMYYVPQLALLHQDSRGFQHVTTHGIDVSKKCLIHHSSSSDSNHGNNSSLSEKPSATTMPPIQERLKKSKIDGGSASIVPVPPSRVSSLGGILILGAKQITYHHTKEGITRVLPMGGGGMLLLTCCKVEENEHHDGRNDENNAVQHKYLLGDELGRLHVLTLLRNIKEDGKGDGVITTLLLETLGMASSSSSLVYLKQGSLFVGSQFGDSQLVQVLDSPVPVAAGGIGKEGASGDDDNDGTRNILEETTYIRVIEEYTNLGPIVDFDLRPSGDDTSTKDVTSSSSSSNHTNLHQHRQSLLATCSGVGKDGSIRLVRNGVGMKEFAEVEMPGIKGMWSLRRKFVHEDDMFLVQSFVRETRILGVQNSGGEEDMADEEEEESAALAEVTIPGFDSSKSTLFAGNMLVNGHDLMVQVVQDGVRVVNSESLELVSQWSPFSDEEGDDDGEPLGLITVASANESGQVVIAVHGGILIYLLVEGASSPAIRKVKHTTLDREISCIDLNPFDSIKDENAMDVDDGNTVRKSQLVVVGLWDDFSVRLLSLNESNHLDQVLHINLGVGSDVGDKTGMAEESNEVNGDTSQHMMARSLCLVSLDSIAASSNTHLTKKGASSSAGSKSDMLLVGLGDGKLISFAVSKSKLSNNWSVHSRKEVSLGTHGISLMRLKNGANLKSKASGTCVLATGVRPTIVYLTGGASGSSSNPKLCYSAVSLTVDDEDEGQASHRNITVNAASSFHSSLLFSSSYSTSDTKYALCVSDENTLRLGVIDDVQKLHVTSFKLGMTPRRIAYHEAGRVYCVGCIDGNADGGRGNQIGAEINMGNCVRFFDDSTLEEINRYVVLCRFALVTQSKFIRHLLIFIISSLH